MFAISKHAKIGWKAFSKTKGLPVFGVIKPPFESDYQGHQVSLTEDQGMVLYQRDHTDGNFSRELFQPTEWVIEPIEPVFTPKKLTTTLLLSLKRVFTIGPKAEQTIYLTFPLEIGVLVTRGNDAHLVDVFAPLAQKFTLYGTPSNGTICKYWETDWSAHPLDQAPPGMGRSAVKVQNTLDTWVEVKQMVFNGGGMRLFYKGNNVTMRATFKILSQLLAETDMISEPLESDMVRAREMVPSKTLNPMRRFVMEAGF